MSDGTLYAMKETDWASLRELEDNTVLAQTYLVERSERRDARCARTESRVHKGLRSCCKDLASQLKEARVELQASEPRYESLTKKAASFTSERINNLRSMALGHMKRVQSPLGGLSTDFDETLAIAVTTLGAPPEAFNEFYNSRREIEASLPEWNCTAEAAALPEKDLLGMCPGGKPHLSEEQLQRQKLGACYCGMCVAERKLTETNKELKTLRPRVIKLREKIKAHSKALRDTKRLIRRFRSTDDDDDEGVEDPVFYPEGETFEGADDKAVLAHNHARATWDTLAKTLTVSDFPLRIVFLDKSGSMGCDKVCYDALQLGVHNSLHPQRGSTLTFLFAAPGETQMFLRRPGDAPIMLNLELGCATWFNEPILRTLSFLAPLVEQLDTKAYMKQWQEPPLQVLCVTDGADNQSPQEINTLAGLVRELKDIVGPVSGQKLYFPITGSVKKHTTLLDETCTQVPVWLAWIVCGMGGQSLLGGKVPKEICMIDAVAVPQLREPDENIREEPVHSRGDKLDDDSLGRCASSTVASRARQRKSGVCGDMLALPIESQAEWRVGHRVRVRASVAGKAPRAATILNVLTDENGKRQYDLIFDDESREEVDSDQLIGAPAEPSSMLKLQRGQGKPKGSQVENGLLARTAEPDQQRWQVLSVVNAVTQDLGAIMNAKSSKSSKLTLEDAVRCINGGEENISDESVTALADKVASAQDSFNVTHERQAPVVEPSALLQDALIEVGRFSARLTPEDRLVAQRYLSVGLEMLLAGGSVMPTHVGDQLGPFVCLQQEMSLRRMRVDSDELDAWKKMLCQPLEVLLQLLLRKELLDCHRTSEGEVVSATQEAFPCLSTIWRYVNPSLSSRGFEDSLRRAVNRFQRTRRSFTFNSRASSNQSSSSLEMGRPLEIGRSTTVPTLDLVFDKERIPSDSSSRQCKLENKMDFLPNSRPSSSRQSKLENKIDFLPNSRPSSSGSSGDSPMSRQFKQRAHSTVSNRSTTPPSSVGHSPGHSQRSRSLSRAGTSFIMGRF